MTLTKDWKLIAIPVVIVFLLIELVVMTTTGIPMESILKKDLLSLLLIIMLVNILILGPGIMVFMLVHSIKYPLSQLSMRAGTTTIISMFLATTTSKIGLSITSEIKPYAYDQNLQAIPVSLIMELFLLVCVASLVTFLIGKYAYTLSKQMSS